MMILKNSNYYSNEANRDYWSVSQFKLFSECEAAGLASVRGEYEREDTDSLLIGRYVDAYFSGEMEDFIRTDGDKIYQKNGKRYKKFDDADVMIDRVERDPLMMEFSKGKNRLSKLRNCLTYRGKSKLTVTEVTASLTLKRCVTFSRCIRTDSDESVLSRHGVTTYKVRSISASSRSLQDSPNRYRSIL